MRDCNVGLRGGGDGAGTTAFFSERSLCHFQRFIEHHLHSDLYCWINLICQATLFTPVKINRHNLHDVYSHYEALMIYVQHAYLNPVCCLQVA